MRGASAMCAASDAWLAPEIAAREASREATARARDDARRRRRRRRMRAPDSDDDPDAGSDGTADEFCGALRPWAASVLRPTLRAKSPAGTQGYQPGRKDASGKAAVVLALVCGAAALGERVLIFTQTLGTLDVLEALLAADHTRLVHRRIDGATPAAARARIVAAFNRSPPPQASANTPRKRMRRLAPALAPGRLTSQADAMHVANKQCDNHEDTCDVLLVSIKAGGEGINLTGASRVVLFDVCWNPCFDHQAKNRV
mmetsp:Transcript_29081/g.86878  ORF Transcript_29081/g.86878 Transcript_29081/m.86878 type:complete len:257 (-) Transcript_29081:624-1394(-)